MNGDDDWLHRAVPRPDAALRLYAFGHAGAGAAAWNPVARGLTPSVELCAIRLAGRERRYLEPPPRSVAVAVADAGHRLLEAIEKDDREFVIAGVCSGALLAYELARFLRDQVARQPRALVVVNHRAAHLRRRGRLRDMHTLSTRDLFTRLRESGAVTGPIAANPAILATFESAIRADYEAAETYVYRPCAPLNYPIVPLRGENARVSAEAMEAWRELTTADANVLQIATGHNALLEWPDVLRSVLNKALAHV